MNPENEKELEYAARHFAFGAENVKIDLRQLIKNHIRSVLGDLKTDLLNTFNRNEKEAIRSSYKSLLRLYDELAELSFGVIDSEIDKIFTIPSEMPFPADEVHEETVSDAEYEELKQQVSALKNKVEIFYEAAKAAFTPVIYFRNIYANPTMLVLPETDHGDEGSGERAGSSRNSDNTFNKEDGLEEKKDANSAPRNDERCKQLAEPVPLETPFEEPTIESEAQLEVGTTWIISPKSFYCQILSLHQKFVDMMHKIPELYNGVMPFTGDVPVGASVLARCPANGFLYRATVDSVEPFDKFIVQYVDYGSKYQVDAVDIWQLDRQLMGLPRMAIHCSLIGVAPVDGEWKVNNLCVYARYQCEFQECVEGQYQVSLWSNGMSVGNMLVEKQLAALSEHQSSVALKDEAIDLTMIVGQYIRGRVTHVESHEKFYAQLDLEKAELVENTIAKFDANLLTPLTQDSLTDGVHCTVKHAGKMYRAILADASDPDNVVAVLPDYGNTITTSLANLMVLPRELRVYYYQALECCLLEYSARSAPREELQARLAGNQFIVHVQGVEGHRLMTTLYDMGTGLKVSPFSAEAHGRALAAAPARDHSRCRARRLQRLADTYRLRALQRGLRYFYGEGTPEPLTEWEPESSCAAKSSDGNWTTIFNATDTDVAVQFPDYGHTETVAKDMLNKLDPSFEPCARPLVVSSGLGAVSDDATDKLDESTTDKQVHVTLAPGPEPATARVTTTEEPATRETVEDGAWYRAQDAGTIKTSEGENTKDSIHTDTGYTSSDGTNDGSPEKTNNSRATITESVMDKVQIEPKQPETAEDKTEFNVTTD